MSCVNHIERFIFIHVAKNGGTSMGSLIPGPTGGHDTLQQFCNRSQKKEMFNFSDYYKWGFARNPWDRVISAYLNCKEVNTVIDTFSEFIKILYKYVDQFQELDTMQWSPGNIITMDELPAQRIHFMPQYPCFTVNGKFDMDFIGRVENIDIDWEFIAKRFNFQPDKPLPKARVNKNRKPYKEYYNNDTKKMVEEIYCKDIEFFNYSYE